MRDFDERTTPLHPPPPAATSAPDPAIRGGRSPATRALSLAAQILLILITAALILAMWLPAIVGPSEAKQRRDQQRWRSWF